jgi:ATP-dependent protease HslVU (ClpYQ) ATPase subunit
MATGKHVVCRYRRSRFVDKREDAIPKNIVFIGHRLSPPVIA